MSLEIRYLDNAATTRVKPQMMQDEINYYIENIGVSAGRSHSKLTRECENRINETRQLIAELFHFQYANNVIFTSGATEGLNLIIKGVLKSGDHVITTCLEHNSVLRPIMQIEEFGIENTIVNCCDNAENLIKGITDAIKTNTKLIVMNHASNVTGEILPVEKIVEIAKEHDVLTLLDCSQSAMKIDIHIDEINVDFAVMSGHKGLMGPTGIGIVLVNNNDVEIIPLKLGGTGLQSEVLVPLKIKPNAYEAGTQNVLGIYGLYGSLCYFKTQEYQEKRRQVDEIYEYMVDELKQIDAVHIHRLGISNRFLPIVSITVDKMGNTDVENYLESKYNIITRSGLHCAPLMHQALGTTPSGTVRISLGLNNTKEDVDVLLTALRNIKRGQDEIKKDYPTEPTFDNLTDHCLFCNPDVHGQGKQVILKTPHFYLFAPLGAIVDGYLIITPYSCESENSSLSEVNANYIDEFNKLRKIVIDFYCDQYGHPGIAFEHGRAGTCIVCKHGTKHCYHGHLCCYPGTVDNELGIPVNEHYYLWEDIPDSFMKVETNGISDLKEKTDGLPYLYIEHCYKSDNTMKQKSVAILIHNEEKLESQYLRKVFAKRVNNYKLWDWKEWPQYESACNLVNQFNEWFHKNRDNYSIDVLEK